MLKPEWTKNKRVKLVEFYMPVKEYKVALAAKGASTWVEYINEAVARGVRGKSKKLKMNKVETTPADTTIPKKAKVARSSRRNPK